MIISLESWVRVSLPGKPSFPAQSKIEAKYLGTILLAYFFTSRNISFCFDLQHIVKTKELTSHMNHCETLYLTGFGQLGASPIAFPTGSGLESDNLRPVRATQSGKSPKGGVKLIVKPRSPRPSGFLNFYEPWLLSCLLEIIIYSI